ncbi:dethiobiotin synthase [Vibrio palustris]|uniref:ATP-dependent dethiobiotin synthetase BioD n=1 Tax=Vibrio palustris TaxID=1918946 RepID=A0A1R4B324_9VIBR|nr:dethiobiotin synthase [Vibrio palustris]SJL83318.1 ATP-dependent dethiobiotin synthetase BioD 1 [Vibrio palustris]
MSQGFFVTGTDTGVGKTVVTKALLHAFAEQKLTTLGYKPISLGCDETECGYRNQDAVHLMQAATEEADYCDINPYMLTLQTSPHIAAHHDGVVIDFTQLDDALTKHSAHADVLLVDGVGGWRVPLSDTMCLSQWVVHAKLPVILVVGIQVGCLNHALLTAEAIRADGLEIAGWVANRINPGTEHYAEIIETLERQLHTPKLGEIPYVPSALRRELSRYININILVNGK